MYCNSEYNITVYLLKCLHTERIVTEHTMLQLTYWFVDILKGNNYATIIVQDPLHYFGELAYFKIENLNLIYNTKTKRDGLEFLFLIRKILLCNSSIIHN